MATNTADRAAGTSQLVYLKADRELPFSDIQRVTDWCRQAGVEEIALVAERRVGR